MSASSGKDGLLSDEEMEKWKQKFNTKQSKEDAVIMDNLSTDGEKGVSNPEPLPSFIVGHEVDDDPVRPQRPGIQCHCTRNQILPLLFMSIFVAVGFGMIGYSLFLLVAPW